MVRTRNAHPDEMGRIAAFYRANEYRPTDVIAITENDRELCGVVRLCEEKSSQASKEEQQNGFARNTASS
jgi:hypothetical protein